MMQKSLSEITEDLQGLLDEVGVEAFPRTKALYLKDVQITDAEGNPIDASDVDLEIALTAEETEAVEEVADEKAAYEDDEEEKADEDEEEDKEDAETKAAEDEENGENRKPRQRLRIGVGVKPGNRVGQAEDLRNPRSGQLDPKSMDAEITKAVSKALKTNVKNKGFDMRIDNERQGMVRWGSLKHINRVSNCADPELEAYKFGRWAAACMGHKKSQDYCKNHGIRTKAHLETVNSQGGFLVPDEFSNTLISLREEYGVFRRNAKIEPMTSDTKRVPKRSATLSASFVGEATAGTESTQTFQSVQLVAKKLMVLTTVSNELNEDSLINLGDSVAGECAYAFALKEDECGFMGDGSSTYGGIVGAVSALNNVSSNAGVNTLGGSDDLPSEVVIADFQDMMGKLPNYADSPNCKFYMHKSIYSAVCERIIYSVGGTSAREVSEGNRGTTFLGYPVEFVQVMPDNTGGSSSTGLDGDQSDERYRFACLFGDLSMAASFGDRRDNTIAFSDSALNAFEQDEIVVRGTERFDIQVHTPGTSAEAGPLVGMKLD
jgi:HK97 family phage major capsid protein